MALEAVADGRTEEVFCMTAPHSSEVVERESAKNIAYEHEKLETFHILISSNSIHRMKRTNTCTSNASQSSTVYKQLTSFQWLVLACCFWHQLLTIYSPLFLRNFFFTICQLAKEPWSHVQNSR